MDVSVKCRKCGKQASAKTFVLDYASRMMVCPLCIKQRKQNIINKKRDILEEKKKERELEELKKKPPGWDHDDDLLEKLYREKKKHRNPDVLQGSGKVKYSCTSCDYEFIYDRDKQKPRDCPYCGRRVGS
jgi:DNA-directed RNA polymerase subunit RPC12/RpoP